MKIATTDVETLGLRTNCVVLSMGICIFDPAQMNSFEDLVAGGTNLYFDQQAQIDAGRSKTPSTEAWWKTQGEGAAECLSNPNQIHPSTLYQVLDQRWTRNEYTQIDWFSRGPHFDIAKLDDMFNDFNITPPWKYWRVRDIRTLMDCYGMKDNRKFKKPEGMIPHNSLHDAAFDAWMMQRVLNDGANIQQYMG